MEERGRKNALSLLRTLKLEPLNNGETKGVVNVLHNVPVLGSRVLLVNRASLDQLVLEVLDVFGLGEEEAD
jgi:hypothetical protein